MARKELEEWYWQFGQDLKRLSDELYASRPMVATQSSWEPKVDLIEEEHRIILKAELAGVKPEEMSLLYVAERHSLLLRGDRPETSYTEGSRVGFHQLEILYGRFEREVKLPNVGIEPEGMRANFKNGLLIVMLPKRERIVVTVSKPVEIN